MVRIDFLSEFLISESYMLLVKLKESDSSDDGLLAMFAFFSFLGLIGSSEDSVLGL